MAATIGQIRLLVQDVSPNNVFEDDHYTEILSIDDTVYGAATIAARALAAHYALKVDTDVKDISIKNSQKFDHYTKLADKYEKTSSSGSNKDKEFVLSGGGAPVATGINNSEIETAHDDDDRYKPAFVRGDLDNPSGSDDIVDRGII